MLRYYKEDEILAKKLQKELDSSKSPTCSKTLIHEKENLVDSELEVVDPTPDIHALFIHFDKRFFWNKLNMVEVKWSPKMTTCAGVCSYQGRNGMCSIRLSAPLLSLRPRKDLVETLLHEMIHAYLFVTDNNRDRDGHGPQFHLHMDRINKEAGTHISVYHSFHDEVKHFQTHWWRCDGPCQHRKPYYGLVKRASNRAPGPNDLWWAQHQANCGGTFIKIREPDKPSKPEKLTKKQAAAVGTKDIRSYLPTSSKIASVDSKNKVKTDKINNIHTLKSLGSSNPVKGPASNSINGRGNVHTFKKPGTSGWVGGGLANKGGGTLVVTKTNKKGSEAKSVEPKPKQMKKETSTDVKTDNSQVVRNKIREVWANKDFEYKMKIKCPTCDKELIKEELSEHEAKCTKSQQTNCPVCEEQIDQHELEVHLESCLNSSFEADYEPKQVNCPVCDKDINENELNEHLENCLNISFENECDDVEFVSEQDVERYPCPCCVKLFSETDINKHIDECLTMLALRDIIQP